MALSSEEWRASTELDRILSNDPVLAVVAGLFAEPARPTPIPPTTRRRPAWPRRAVVVLISALALVVALTGTFLAAVVGPPATAGRESWSASRP